MHSERLIDTCLACCTDSIGMNHTGRLSSSCIYDVPWPWSFFVSCVDTGQQMAGIVFGIIAVLLWIALNGLLIHMRHMDYKADRMAVGWLLHRSVADLLNFTGTLMARQFAPQVWFALSMLVTDVVLCIHYVVMRIMALFYLPKPQGDVCNTYQPPEEDDDADEEDDAINEPSQWEQVVNFLKYKIKNFPIIDRIKRRKSLNTLCLATPWILVMTYMKSSFLSDFHENKSYSGTVTHRGRTLLQTSSSQRSFDPLGYALGTASTFLYWGEYLPLIMHTAKEQTLTRLDMIYQIVYVVCNVFYLLAVFVQLTDGWIFAHTLPWTLGRFGLNIIGIGILINSHMLSLRKHYWTISDEDSLLRESSGNNGDWITLSDIDMEAKPWTPLKSQAKNRYLQKMSGIAEHMEDGDKSADGDKDEAVLFDKSCVHQTPDGSTKLSETQIPISRLTPPSIDSDLEWEFEWKGVDMNHELDEDEISRLLEEEDARWAESRSQDIREDRMNR